VPFEDSYIGSVVADIRLGKRPPRPTDPARNEWLHNHVWDVITTCWSDKPEQRSGLSALHHTFSTLSPQIAKTAKSARSERQGNLIVWNRRNITIAKQSRMTKQRHSDAGQSFLGSRLSYRLCEVQTQGSRNLLTAWIRQVFPPTSHPKANMSCSVLRISKRQIGNGSSCSTNFARHAAGIE
jgi:hypothetical protein